MSITFIKLIMICQLTELMQLNIKITSQNIEDIADTHHSFLDFGNAQLVLWRYFYPFH